MKYVALISIAFLVPASALAASLTLAPASIHLTPGQSITLTLTADPASATIASIKADIAYDPALLEETAFAFAPGWIALTQPGYDSVDNGIGSVIKTAGYPGGIFAPTVLGTITVRAKAAGTASVIAAGDTQMLSGEGTNEFVGTESGAVIAITATPAPIHSAYAVPKLQVAASTSVANTSTSTAPLRAAAGSSGSSVLVQLLMTALIAFVVGALTAYGLSRRWTA